MTATLPGDSVSDDLPPSTRDPSGGQKRLPLLGSRWTLWFLAAGAAIGASAGIYSWVAGSDASSPWEEVAASGIPVLALIALVVGIDRILITVAQRSLTKSEEWQADAYKEVRSLVPVIAIAATPAYALVVILVAFSDSWKRTIAAALLLLFGLGVTACAVGSGAREARLRATSGDLDALLDAIDISIQAEKGRLDRSKRSADVQKLERDWAARKAPTSGTLSEFERRVKILRESRD